MWRPRQCSGSCQWRWRAAAASGRKLALPAPWQALGHREGRKPRLPMPASLAALLRAIRAPLLGLLLGLLLGTTASRRSLRAPCGAHPKRPKPAKQKFPEVGLRSDAQRHERLCRAVTDAGGRIHEAYSVEWCSDYGCDGVVAKVNVAKDTVIVDLPLSQCAVSAAPEGDGPVPGSSAGVRLVRVLLHHLRRGEGSPLAPYLAALPRAFSEPSFWDAGSEEMLALSGSRLASSIASAHQEAELAAAALVSEIRRHSEANPSTDLDDSVITLENILWAKKVQVTRAFELDLTANTLRQPTRVSMAEPEEAGAAASSSIFTVMAPLIDMANHSSAPEGVNAYFTWSSDASVPPQSKLELRNVRLQMVAARDIEAGEQIQLDYDHTASPLGLFQRYGIPPVALDLIAVASPRVSATAASGAAEGDGRFLNGRCARPASSSIVQQLRRRHEVLVAFPPILASPMYPMWKVRLLARCYSIHTPWLPSRSDLDAQRAVAKSAGERVRWRLAKLAEDQVDQQEHEEEDREALEEWAWACEEREDMCIEAEGFGFLLMDMLRIVALDSEPVPVSARASADSQGHCDDSEDVADLGIEQLESPAAWENTIALSLLADICRSQLQGYRRYTVPGHVRSDLVTSDAGELAIAANAPVPADTADSNARVIAARRAVEYERALLLRKLGEIERALQDTTAVRLRSNSVAMAEATHAIRQRRAFARRRQALQSVAMPE